MLNWLRAFAKDTRGNTVMLFGFALVPIVGVAGMAMDYSRAVATETALQNAIDATGLMLAGDIKRSPAELNTDAKRLTRAQGYFNSQFNGRHSLSPSVNVSYTPGSSANGGRFNLVVTATATVPTMLSRVLGPERLPVATTADITWGLRRLEVALALDNTGSMASNNKMVELKKATRNLLDTLFNSAMKAGDVKVAIIPFATDVNVGKARNLHSTWLDWTSWDAANRVCTNRDWLGNCTSSVVAGHGQWNGCVWDRTQPYDANDTAPTSTATRFQPHQDDSCPVELQPLTDIFTGNAWKNSDKTATNPSSELGKKVDSMQPVGNTNVSIGMAWAWHALTKGEPLTEAENPATDLDKVVILLTDGDNTENRWGSGQTQINNRTSATCTNAKAAGISIYTIRMIDGNANLLRSCATSPGMFYDVDNAADLNTVFATIAQNLAGLRIAK